MIANENRARARDHFLTGDLVLSKTIFAAAAIAALIGTPAMAADMPVKAPPRTPVPVATSWTGCYVNGGVGYGLSNRDHFAFNNTGFVNKDGTSGAKGWLGTIGGGCDYQFSPGSGWGNWVVGAFADYDFMDLHGGFTDGTFDATAPEKESWAAAVGGRVGLLVTPQVLTYVNGGWTSTRFDAVNFPAGGNSWPAHTFSGGFIGGGTEVAVAAVPGLYWRNEYRLSSYQPDNLQRLVNGVPTNLFSHQSATVQTITTSLVWKFNAMPASAADLAGKAPPHAPMAVKAPPRTPVPVATSWTGCYVNGGVGHGLNSQDHFDFNTAGFKNRDETSGGRGWLGTVGGGCDYQFSPANGWGTWVVGAFADYDFMDLHGAFNVAVVQDPAPRKENWAAAVGGRIGVLVTPQILTYVNGGWTSTRFGDVDFPGTRISLPAHTFNGGFIGGGTEVAVAAVPGLYWRNEYRLSSYRPADLPFFVRGVAINTFNHQSATVQTITTSLVWKFNATPGLAADTSGKAPPHASMLVKASPRAPVATTWTGCYVNGGVGYGVNNQDHFAFDPTGANPNETSAGRGYLGKVGGGCDYQFNPASGWGNWVVGAFADFDLMDLHGGFFDEAAQVTGAPVREIWAGGVGARIGFLVTPQILTYVNGGWTPTRFDAVNFPGTRASLPGQTFNGGFIGGGTENVPGLFWRNEYRLSSYRATNLQFSVNGMPIDFFDHQSATVQTITTSLVLKFH